jgi:transcriptional regulator with XRE-family HTH domain
MRSSAPLPRENNGMRASALLGTRLRALREQNGFSQGDLEKRTGLLRCYISSVEHSHTVPSIDTLEKIARALSVPLYSLFDERAEAKLRQPRSCEGTNSLPERGPKEDLRFLRLLRRHVHHLDDQHRSLLLFLARTMARMITVAQGRNGQ